MQDTLLDNSYHIELAKTKLAAYVLTRQYKWVFHCYLNKQDLNPLQSIN